MKTRLLVICVEKTGWINKCKFKLYFRSKKKQILIVTRIFHKKVLWKKFILLMIVYFISSIILTHQIFIIKPKINGRRGSLTATLHYKCAPNNLIPKVNYASIYLSILYVFLVNYPSVYIGKN